MDAMGLVGLLLLWLFGRNGSKPAPASSPPALPGPAAPWPAAVPDGLPSFPGAGWEYDEPPPQAVQQRASQLVAPLWRQGKGSFRTEQTAGRWITYRAEIVRSGKQGVVAYRVKGGGTLKTPPKDTASAPAPAPSSPRTSSTSWTLPAILTSTSPGWPQPQAGGFVQVQAGKWYQWNARIDLPPGAVSPANQRAFAEGIAKGLAAAGAVNIAVSTDVPYVVAYQLRAPNTITVPLGVAIGFEVLGQKCSITFLAGREVPAPTGPKVPAPDVVMTSAPAAPAQTVVLPGGSIEVRPPSSLPTLRRGAGMKPAAPDPYVKLLQQKLGIEDDGRFGDGTLNQVKAFQATQALNKLGWSEKDIDGVVGKKTWAALFASPWSKA